MESLDLGPKAKSKQNVPRAIELFEEWRTSHEDRHALAPVALKKLSGTHILNKKLWEGYAYLSPGRACGRHQAHVLCHHSQ